MVAIIVVRCSSILLSLAAGRRGTSRHRAGGPNAEEKAAPRKARAALPPRLLPRGRSSPLAVFGAQFGGASIAFLWPNLKGGFGSTINAGSVQDIQAQIQQTHQPFYYGAGRFYVVPYNGTGRTPVILRRGLPREGSLMALYQRCVHLGCRVPYCQTSPVVRMPVPRLEVQQGRRVPAGAGPDRAAAVPDHRRRATTCWSTPRPSTPARRGARTRPTSRPKGRSACDGGMLALGRSSLPGSSSRSLAIAIGIPFVAGSSRTGAQGRAAKGAPDIPPVMQPGPSDGDLEKSRLEKLQGWSLAFVALFAADAAARVAEGAARTRRPDAHAQQSIERGAQSVQLFSEENQLGVGCVRCHGDNPVGGGTTSTTACSSTRRRSTTCAPGRTCRSTRRSTTSTTSARRSCAAGPARTCRRGASGSRAPLDDQQIQDILNYIVSIQKDGGVKLTNVCINPSQVEPHSE